MVERTVGVITKWRRRRNQKEATLKESATKDGHNESAAEAGQSGHKTESHSCEGLTLMVHTSKGE
jgi:hypothetical protein